MTSGVSWPAGTVAEVLAAYRGGESAPSISRRLGCSTAAIYGWLDIAGVQRVKGRPMRGVGSPDLPEQVLTPGWLASEAGAWALGIHVTDGYLRQPKGRPGESPSLSLRVALKTADRAGLEMLAEAYGLDPARVRSNDDMAILDFAHPRLSFLAAIGQPVGRKTGEAALPDSLLRNVHAWRGALDGDGYVSLLQPSGRRPQLHAGLRASSLRLRTQFADAAAEILGGEQGICVHARGVTVTNVAAVHLISTLYGSVRFTIPRKRDKALRLALEYGNAVTPPVAEVIISALVEAISGEALERAA